MCSAVNLDVLRGFEPDVSQSYHNRVAHLARVARYALVLDQTLVIRSVDGHQILLAPDRCQHSLKPNGVFLQNIASRGEIRGKEVRGG
jgi:hypothetical protein